MFTTGEKFCLSLNGEASAKLHSLSASEIPMQAYASPAQSRQTSLGRDEARAAQAECGPVAVATTSSGSEILAAATMAPVGRR